MPVEDRSASRALGGWSRRTFLSGAAVSLAALACSRRSADLAQGRQRASLWFTYGGRNRQVLEGLVASFNATQERFYLEAFSRPPDSEENSAALEFLRRRLTGGDRGREDAWAELCHALINAKEFAFIE